MLNKALYTEKALKTIKDNGMTDYDPTLSFAVQNIWGLDKEEVDALLPVVDVNDKLLSLHKDVHCVLCSINPHNKDFDSPTTRLTLRYSVNAFDQDFWVSISLKIGSSVNRLGGDAVFTEYQFDGWGSNLDEFSVNWEGNGWDSDKNFCKKAFGSLKEWLEFELFTHICDFVAYNPDFNGITTEEGRCVRDVFGEACAEDMVEYIDPSDVDVPFDPGAC